MDVDVQIQIIHFSILCITIKLHCKYFEINPKSEEIVHFYIVL